MTNITEEKCTNCGKPYFYLKGVSSTSWCPTCSNEREKPVDMSMHDRDSEGS